MAEIRTDGTRMVIQLTPLERLGALHAPVRVARASVRSAHIADDPWTEVRGRRAPGTSLTGVILLGTMRGAFGRDFCALYDRRPAVVLELEGEKFSRILVTVEHPQRTIDALGLSPAARWACRGSA